MTPGCFRITGQCLVPGGECIAKLADEAGIERTAKENGYLVCSRMASCPSSLVPAERQ
jgi:hypothetical protein